MGSAQGQPWIRELLEGRTEPWDDWILRWGADIEATAGREHYLKLKARRDGASSEALKALSADVAPLLLELPPELFVTSIQLVTLPDLTRELVKANDAHRRKFGKVLEQAIKETFGGTHVGVAACALCGYAGVRRVLLWGYNDRFLEDSLFDVLATRRPEWLGKWVEQELSEPWMFGLIRRLIRAGACEKPSSEGYYTALVRSRCGIRRDEAELVEVLRADPELLDDALKAFELDPATGAFYEWAPAYVDPRVAERTSWGHAFMTLLRDGQLARDRLIDAALSTLGARIQLRGTAFYLKLLEQLALTPAEREARSTAYLDLLSHPISPVVKHALSAVSALIKAGHAGEGYVDALASVFEAEPKGNALASVRLLRTVGKKQRALRGAIAVAAAHGLQHANADVQEKALALVEEYWDGASPEPLDVIRGYVELVAATNRARVLALIGASDDESTEGDINAELRELLEEAGTLPTHLAELAGLPSLVASCTAGTSPEAYQPQPGLVPRLRDDSRVQPIASLDELIDALLAVLEDREDAVAVERCIDGISRHAGERTPDFETRTSALLDRAKSASHDSLVVNDLGWLITCWLQRQPKPRPERLTRGRFEVFFELRTTEIAQRARGQIHAATLSLPTHRQGWVAPGALVERLRAAQRAELKFMQADFVQALLRLAPDGRAAALAAASDLHGEMGSALRYALGDEFVAVGSHPHYWAAAARARHGAGSAPELEGTAADSGPFGAQAAHYAWEVRKLTLRHPTTDDHRLRLTVRPEEPRDFTKSEYFPATASLRDGEQRLNYFCLPLDARLRGMLWPLNPDAAFWRGGQAITERLFANASVYSATAPYLEPLFDPDLPFSEPAQVCVALALIAQDADARTTAADVVAALMEDGRCDGSDLGALFVRMRGTASVRMGRVAESLSRVQVAGPAQQWACARCLETLLAGLDSPLPKDAHHLLELLAELNTALGRPCLLRPVLSAIKGSGKAAKAAKRILDQSGASEFPAAVAAQLLRARIERVRRWAESPFS